MFKWCVLSSKFTLCPRDDYVQSVLILDEELCRYKGWDDDDDDLWYNTARKPAPGCWTRIVSKAEDILSNGISPAQRIFPTSDDGKKNEQSDIKTFESYYNVTNEKDLHKELKSN